MLAILLVFLGFSQVGIAKEKPKQKPYVLTAHEQKVVEDAKKLFAKSKKEKPPSAHMRDKMQSSEGKVSK